MAHSYVTESGSDLRDNSGSLFRCKTHSLPVIKIVQLRKGNTEGAERASSNIPKEYIVNDGDVLFAWSGSLEVEIWCGGSGAHDIQEQATQLVIDQAEALSQEWTRA
ncbi:MAG: hypothetical protein ACPLRU_00245 [Desulfofundulus sp.]